MLGRTADLDLGRGVYTVAGAASIIRAGEGYATARQLYYWTATGLLSAEPTKKSKSRTMAQCLLSFDDLITLELVARFRRHRVALQQVRRFEHRLREAFPSLARPFANRVLFTDGVSIWAEWGESEGRQLLELVGRRPGHYVWTDAIQSFAEMIEYDEEGAAASWHLNRWVEVNPNVQFGEPVIRGTRVPVRTVAANLKVGTPEEVAEWYGLTRQQVEGAQDYLRAIA